MNSHDVSLLREAATQLTEDGRHTSFYRLCESYGRWVKSGVSEPQLFRSFLAGRSENHAFGQLRISDQIGLFLDSLLCELKAMDIAAYQVLEIMFMTRNDPYLVRAKNARLIKELKRQGKRPTRAMIDKLKEQSVEALRCLVLAKLSLAGVDNDQVPKGRVWNSSSDDV